MPNAAFDTLLVKALVGNVFPSAQLGLNGAVVAKVLIVTSVRTPMVQSFAHPHWLEVRAKENLEDLSATVVARGVTSHESAPTRRGVKEKEKKPKGDFRKDLQRANLRDFPKGDLREPAITTHKVKEGTKGFAGSVGR